MKTKFSKYFEVKIQYQKILENGKEKRVSEQYVVEALSFTEAEARIIEEMTPYVSGEFDVVSEKIAPFNEIFLSDRTDDDKWFISKVGFIFRAVKPTGLQPVGCKALSLVSNIFHNCIWAGFAY